MLKVNEVNRSNRAFTALLHPDLHSRSSKQMKKAGTISESGVSIVETLIVLVIVVIVVTFAVVSFSRGSRNLSRQNVAREFKVSLERARFDSVKRRASVCSDMSRVTVNNATSFTVTTDLNQNGTLEAAEARDQVFGIQGDVTMVGNGVTFPVTIRFDERGHAVLSDCVSTPPPNVPLLYFCNGACTPSTANSQNSNVVFVSPTGTVAMLTGGETMPTFANPSVANVNSNVQVNPMLAVWAPTTPSPTPTPTPIPPTPVPTPTPTPYYCPGGSGPWQVPSQTGCICKAPMWVRSNGQCK